MTNKQRAEEIWKQQLFDLCDRGGIKHGFSGIEETVWKDINTYHENLITQALDEAYARGQQSVLAKMPIEQFITEAAISYDESEFGNTRTLKAFQAGVNYLRTKLTEGEL